MQGSWAAEYDDGTVLQQWDASHPMAVHGEVPYRAIAWDRVRAILFESGIATTRYDIPPAPEGLRWRLQSRSWMGLGGAGVVVAFMLVLADAAQPNGSAEGVHYVKFWFPDGAEHETPFFHSPEAAAYGTGLAHGLQRSLPQATRTTSVALSATLNGTLS